MNRETLNNLKQVQEEIEIEKKQLSELKQQFEDNNQELIMSIKNKTEEMNSYKSVIIENAEVGFKKDGIKKRLGGIGIRETTKLDYAKEDALNWAIEHKLCLSLDTKAFESLNKTPPLMFVVKVPIIKVTFPKVINLEDE